MTKNIAQKIVSNLFHLFTLAFLFLWCGNASAAAVKALKKGLYIINGKKVVIM